MTDKKQFATRSLFTETAGAAETWTPMDFAPALAAEFGNRPGMLLDSTGKVIAVNQQAAALLGRTPEQLTGTSFGVWGPALDQIELDVVKKVGNKAHAIVIRALKIGRSIEVEDGYIPVLLQELPPPRTMTLAQAVGLAFFDVNGAAGEGLHPPRVEKLPSVQVLPRARHSIGQVVQSLVGLAGIGTPELTARFSGQGAGWVEIEIALNLNGAEQPDSPQELTDQRPLPVCEEEDRRCTLSFDHPRLTARLRLPCEALT
ncbi:MAG: hypothetical protein SFV51_02550 [Bryobacteraceae bacterium]|nr:hypothetical protein [Bryobacteraceae bacterium]